MSTRQASSGNSDGERSDEALLDAFYQGDDEAYEILFKRYRALLHWLARSYGLNDDDAQEQAHLAFVKLYLSRKKLVAGLKSGWYNQRENVKLKTWLCKILTNNCLDFLRKRKVQTRLFESIEAEKDEDQPSLQETLPDPGEPLYQILINKEDDRVRSQLQQIVRDAMKSLPERQRLALALRFYLGEDFNSEKERTLAEIATTLGTSVPTIYRELGRATKALKQVLSAHPTFIKTFAALRSQEDN